MTTSWQNSKQWYNRSVGEDGHYYHRTLIIPKTLKLLKFEDPQEISVLDLACGQGVFSRHLPEHAVYCGVDLSPGLIAEAKNFNRNRQHQFLMGDVTKPLKLEKKDFSHAIIMLAIQNMENPKGAFQNAYHFLKNEGQLLLIMNHPCFRIPRQTSWQVDAERKIQYRRVDRYMSDMHIPIATHPGKGQASPQTQSFHHPLSVFSQWLHEAGFSISLIEEWCSNKTSEGGAAKMENRSRQEIPLFMAILARKKATN